MLLATTPAHKLPNKHISSDNEFGHQKFRRLQALDVITCAKLCDMLEATDRATRCSCTMKVRCNICQGIRRTKENLWTTDPYVSVQFNDHWPFKKIFLEYLELLKSCLDVQLERFNVCQIWSVFLILSIECPSLNVCQMTPQQFTQSTEFRRPLV